MRTSFFLLSALFLVAACAKDAETTAPHSQVPAVSSNLVANAPSAFPPGPTAKPSPFTTVTSSDVVLDGVNVWGSEASVICPAGYHVTGGGYETTSGFMNVRIIDSGPLGGNAWRVYGVVNLGLAASFKVIAVCMS